MFYKVFLGGGALWLRMVENLWFSIIFLRVSPINLSYCVGRARGFWLVAIFWRCSMSFSWIHDGMTKTNPEMFGIHRTFWQTLIPLAYDISVAVDAVDDILSSPTSIVECNAWRFWTLLMWTSENTWDDNTKQNWRVIGCRKHMYIYIICIYTLYIYSIIANKNSNTIIAGVMTGKKPFTVSIRLYWW